MTATLTPADLDALDQALAAIGRYEPDGHKVQWRSFFRDDLAAAVDAIVRAAPALLAEVRWLRSDLAAARLDAANARAVAGEVIDALADPGVPSRSIADLRSRLAAPSDFAARAREAVDALVGAVAGEDADGYNAARSVLLALLGVRS